MDRTLSRKLLKAFLLVPFFLAVVFHPNAFGATNINAGCQKTVDGVVKGSDWPGNGGLNFIPYNTDAQHKTVPPTLFLAGYTPDSQTSMSTIYLGLHVQDDPVLNEKDRLVLYFKADGGAAWNGSDFALLYEIGSVNNPINNSKDSNKTPGNGYIYRYEGGHWVSKGAIPAGITTRVSWNYIAGDPGTGTWELEMGIDAAQMGLKAPANGDGFKLGAKLYVDEGLTTPIWHWPAADLTSVPDNPLLYDPDEGGVTPAKLEQISMVTGSSANCCCPVKPTTAGLSSLMLMAGIAVLQRKTDKKGKDKKEDKE